MKASCDLCGKTLNEFSGYPSPAKWKTVSGYAPYCVECQQKYFDALKATAPPLVAHFYCCAAFNVPFIKSELPRFDKDGLPWKAYVERLRFRGLNSYESTITDENGNPKTVLKYKGFFDGETDIVAMLGAVVENPEKLQERMEYGFPRPRQPKNPTANQVKRWGDGRTYEECKELDRIYDNIGNAYKGNPDPRVEINLIKLAKLQYEQDRAIAEKDFDTAKRIQEIMKSTQETEGMKATDAKPVENLRIDAIAEYLEKNGAMRNRKLVGKPELIKILQKGKHKFTPSLDVVDEMLFAILNAVRKNDGLSELYEIPLDMQIQDEKDELPKRVSEAEKNVLAELGMILSPKEQ